MTKTWSLAEWLDYLEHRHTPEIQLRLVNAQKVAHAMDLLVWPIPVITVGGTNGKGSTVAALTAIYTAAGYKVGHFTSPHLLSFNERIGINNVAIADEALCAAFAQVDVERQDTPLTYFEMSFLAALFYFKQADVDVMILEVGVGGRLDATNIIDADVAIITTVDLDHQDYLGHDKEAIGYEKAGILRSEQFFIYADATPPQTVLSHARLLGTSMICLGQQYHHQVMADHWHIVRDHDEPIVLPIPSIHHNAAAAAVLATEHLRSRLPIQHKDWVQAMLSVSLMGRLQWVAGDVSFLYDVAHNPQAATLLAQHLSRQSVQGKIHAIFSALQDKDICGLIRPLSSFVNHWYPVELAGNRATKLEGLLSACDTVLGCRPLGYAEPAMAYQAALQAAQGGDVILVYGSFILVAAVMKHSYR